MTLILALRTPRWVALAADRMLSVPPNGKPVSETATKLVLFRNEMVFGMTGIAKLPAADGKLIPTDKWLTHVLAEAGEAPLEVAIQCLIERTNDVLPRARIAFGRSFPLAFLGMGWATIKGSPIDRPTCVEILITNFHEPGPDAADGRTTLIHGQPRERCFAAHQFEPNDIVYQSLSSVGYTMTNAEIKWIGTRLKRAIDAGRAGITLVHLLKEAIRRTSKRLNNRYVGQDVLAAVLPIEAVRSDIIVVSDPRGTCGIVFENGDLKPPEVLAAANGNERAVFLRFPKGKNESVYESPHVVAPGYRHAGWFGSGTQKGSIRVNVDRDPITHGIRAIQDFRFEIEEHTPRRRRAKKK